MKSWKNHSFLLLIVNRGIASERTMYGCNTPQLSVISSLNLNSITFVLNECMFCHEIVKKVLKITISCIKAPHENKEVLLKNRSCR